jgi:hypothetical protein
MGGESGAVMGSMEMAAIAAAANQIARDIRTAIDKFAPKVLSTRQRLARALLTSSIEQSIALTQLLARNDPYCAYPALTLFRPQLEALARGVFFAIPASSSDEEVASFLAADKMPKRQPEDGGKRRAQTLRELLDSTREVLRQFLPPNLAARVDYAYTYDLNLYNVIVHGGAKVDMAYRLSGDRLLFAPEFYQLMNIARHSMAQAHFAEGVLSAIVYRLDTPPDVTPERIRLIEAYGALSKQAGRRAIRRLVHASLVWLPFRLSAQRR